MEEKKFGFSDVSCESYEDYFCGSDEESWGYGSEKELREGLKDYQFDGDRFFIFNEFVKKYDIEKEIDNEVRKIDQLLNENSNIQLAFNSLQYSQNKGNNN